MNRERAKQLLPIIQAFAEGKNIQFRQQGVDEWDYIESPTFLDMYEYRIEPPSPMKLYRVEYRKHGSYGWNLWQTYENKNVAEARYNDALGRVDGEVRIRTFTENVE